MQINHYTLRVRHDAGFVTIRTTASSEEAARQAVMEAERCPASAIRRVWRGKLIWATPANCKE